MYYYLERLVAEDIRRAKIGKSGGIVKWRKNSYRILKTKKKKEEEGLCKKKKIEFFQIPINSDYIFNLIHIVLFQY